jgi:hypothetical protein
MRRTRPRFGGGADTSIETVDGEVARGGAKIRLDRAFGKVQRVSPLVDGQKRVADAFFDFLPRLPSQHGARRVVHKPVYALSI